MDVMKDLRDIQVPNKKEEICEEVVVKEEIVEIELVESEQAAASVSIQCRDSLMELKEEQNDLEPYVVSGLVEEETFFNREESEEKEAPTEDTASLNESIASPHHFFDGTDGLQLELTQSNELSALPECKNLVGETVTMTDFLDPVGEAASSISSFPPQHDSHPESELNARSEALHDYSQSNLYKCGRCYFISSEISTLKRHLRTHLNKPIRCYYCPYTALVKSHMNKHMLHKHSGEKPFKCDVCSFSSRVKWNLKKHQKIHLGEKEFKCGECSYSAYQRSDLLQHARIHSDERPFKCDACSFSAKTKDTLKKHLKFRCLEKPFKCKDCNYSTHQSSALLKHSQLHSDDRPFKCSECPYSAKFRHILLTHRKIHSGEKPFECGLCSYSTHRKIDLTKHSQIHSNERPYKCDQCPYASKAKNNLQKHLNTHYKKLKEKFF